MKPLTKKETLQALAIGSGMTILFLACIALIPPDPSHVSGRGRVATAQEKRLMNKITNQSIEAAIVDKMVEKENRQKKGR
jgi:uncharacterized protein involved in tolerance to divalent cations